MRKIECNTRVHSSAMGNNGNETIDTRKRGLTGQSISPCSIGCRRRRVSSTEQRVTHSSHSCSGHTFSNLVTSSVLPVPLTKRTLFLQEKSRVTAAPCLLQDPCHPQIITVDGMLLSGPKHSLDETNGCSHELFFPPGDLGCR